MGSSRVLNESNKKGKNQIPSLPNVDKLGLQKSFFGVSSDIDIIAWLKRVALDPCNPQASHSSVQKLHDQALKTWKILVMSNAECPRKKRKFELFLKGSNVTASSRPFEDKSTNRSTKKVSGTSSVSHSLDSYDGAATCYHSIGCSFGSGGIMVVEDNFQGKPMKANLVCSDNAKNSNPRKSLEYPKVKDILFIEDDDSAQNSDSLSSGIYMTPQQAVELLKTTGECPPRPVIPIGPRFQAEVPEWTGTGSKIPYRDRDGLEALKWLGTKCWPREGASVDRNTNTKAIGKGRPDSCSCSSPGSVYCVKRHISEARRKLRSDLGPLFLTSKFDEMGETISSSWTSSEQERFASLVKDNPLHTAEDFWDCAMKSFPSKCLKTLLKYYYNVYLPRRMRIDTRSSLGRDVASDDDEPEESDDDEPEEQRGNKKVQRLLKTCKR